MRSHFLNSIRFLNVIPWPNVTPYEKVRFLVFQYIRFISAGMQSNCWFSGFHCFKVNWWHFNTSIDLTVLPLNSCTRHPLEMRYGPYRMVIHSSSYLLWESRLLGLKTVKHILRHNLEWNLLQHHIIYMTVEKNAENYSDPWQDGSSKVDNEIIKI